MKNYFPIFILFILFFACNLSSTKKVVKTTEPEEKNLDTLLVTVPQEVVEEPEEIYDRGIYQAAATRKVDLLHTKLDLSFDWDKQHVLGKAEVTFTPIFYAVDSLLLHAKNFDIHVVKSTNKNGKVLQYQYDGEAIHIALGKVLEKGQKYTVYIDYTAKPNEGYSGGSSAITSEKGLYFINPLGTDKKKPRQIWTQGETESNRRWFPTFDKPNERMTQEMYLTVDEEFETLSNGILVSSTPLGNGKRTDYWKMSKPHAPYLFMIVVGDFAIANDTWKNIPLQYYVEHAYAEDAKEIYNHTPEMLTFFSQLIGYPYPWEKFSQVVVRDYVSGAMENTTAVIFGEFIQKHKDELSTNNNDDIVAHEMFHHWFGDLVTTENWANLTLNEGFANYSEYLWREYKYGVDKAEDHRTSQLNGYLQQANSDMHPLIDYEYTDEMQMFDQHSYNKGGLVLHMLRNYLGDEGFFAGLQKYLKDNQYTAVEVDELRMAFEDLTGQDLQWFFNQWFLEAGHPVLEITEEYNEEHGTVNVFIEQTQDPELAVPVYKLLLDVEIIYDDGKREIMPVTLDERQQSFTLDVEEKPLLVIVDPQFVNLAVMKQEFTSKEIIAILQNIDNYRRVSEALEKIPFVEDENAAQNVLQTLANDDYYRIRWQAIEKMKFVTNADFIADKVKNDSSPYVRARSLELLSKKNDPRTKELAEDMHSKGQSLLEKMSAIEAMYTVDKVRGVELAEKYIDNNSTMVQNAILDILISTGNKKYISVIENAIMNASGFGSFSLLSIYTSFMSTQKEKEVFVHSVEFLSSIVSNKSTNSYTMFSAMRALGEIRNNLENNANLDFPDIVDDLTSTFNSAYEAMGESQFKSALSAYVK